jgi:hypothetical protein
MITHAKHHFSIYRRIGRATGLLLLGMVISQSLWAHVVVGELEKMSRTEAAFLYLQLGYKHILPLGFDHILFVISLLLVNPRLKPVLWQATAFTLAHSITLALAMYHVINPPAAVIEPLIALSILYVAIENIFSSRLKASRIIVVFIFGLVHGLGFASALGQLGLPQNAYLLSLVMFNAGVELGQLTVILPVFFVLTRYWHEKPFYRKRIVLPASVITILVAGYWTIERLFL